MQRNKLIKEKDLNTDELLAEIARLKKELKKKKKYGLVWEEKKEDVVEMCKEKLPVLVEDKSKVINEAGEDDPVNILIEGDNYHALSALNYTHEGKIDVIYIDPPYNTGNRDFKYNDNYVDKEDGFRHSKWLSFMYKRLILAKTLLKDSGIIFISIDDNEMANLKLLMDDQSLFGENSFIVNFIRRNKFGGGHDSGLIAIEYDYVLSYAKKITKVYFKKEIIDTDSQKKYKYSDKYIEKRGRYYLRDLDYKGSYSASLDYPLKTPDGKKIFAGGKFGKPNTWRWSEQKVEWGKKSDFIVFKKFADKWKVYIKQYQFVDNNDKLRVRQLPYRGLIEFGNSQGSQQLNIILNQELFNFPKPIELITFLTNLHPNKNCTILDFFAGTGTSAQAVLELNKEDDGKRKFILVTNNENNICTDVCYPRISKVIKGYKNKKGEKVKGLGGNLRYYKTEFIDAKQTDKNKKLLTEKATDLLCIKEDTYDEIKTKSKHFRIFKRGKKYTGIIYDYMEIESFKEFIKKIEGKFSVYIFSLADETFDEEFEDLGNKVKLSPIPEAIMRVYRRVFK